MICHFTKVDINIFKDISACTYEGSAQILPTGPLTPSLFAEISPAFSSNLNFKLNLI